MSKDGYKARIRQVEEALEAHPRALATGGSTESIRSSSGPGLAMLPFLTINDIIALRREGFKGLQDIEERVLEVPDVAWEHVLELIEAGIARIPQQALVPPSPKAKKQAAAKAAAASNGKGASDKTAGGAGAKAPAPKPAPPKKVKQERCAATTADGKRCKNPSRKGSKYCSSHKGYRPPPKKKAKKKKAPKKAKKKKAPKKKKAAKKGKKKATKGRKGKGTTKRGKAKPKRKAKKKPSKKTPKKRAPKRTKGSGQARCQAKTADGRRCKNPSRKGSKYCSSHKGYRPTKR